MATNIGQRRMVTVEKNGQIVEELRQVDVYIYSFEVASIAAAANTQQTISIQADADFICTEIVAFADVAGAAQEISTQVLPLVRIQMLDQGSGRNLFNSPISLSQIAGNATQSRRLPVQRYFSANSAVTMTFVNYSAATTYANLQVSLIGYKAFR